MRFEDKSECKVYYGVSIHKMGVKMYYGVIGLLCGHIRCERPRYCGVASEIVGC